MGIFLQICWDCCSGRAAVMAVRSIQLERKVREMEEATKIATKRSGARGFDARKVLVSLEGQVCQQSYVLKHYKKFLVQGLALD